MRNYDDGQIKVLHKDQDRVIDKMAVSVELLVVDTTHLSESEDNPRAIAVLGQEGDASDRLSAILLLSITSSL